MARQRLGNDPFERGAAFRPELSAPSATPAEGAESTKAAEATARQEPPPIPEPSHPLPGNARVEAKAATDRKGRAKRRSSRSAIDLEPRPEPSPEPQVASLTEASTIPPEDPEHPPPEPPPEPPPTTHLEAVPELLETAGERLRHLLERRLPDLAERTGRLLSEGLGLIGPPSAVPEVDPFGMSPDFVDRWQPVLALLLERYFRLSVEGIDRIPATGPALLVCNHSGVLPFDEILIKAAVTERHPGRRTIRPLSEDFAIHFPFAGSWLNRFGCVRACPENAERLLGEGQVVAVFPEGSHGIGKLYRNRYRLQRFGRGGFVKLALCAGVPIIPVALLGAEEAHPVLARIDLPRSLGLGVPYLPITPTFPWLGPLGLWPLPTRFFLKVGEPVELTQKPSDALDRPLIARLAEEIRAQVQELLDGMLADRRSVFF